MTLEDLIAVTYGDQTLSLTTQIKDMINDDSYTAGQLIMRKNNEVQSHNHQSSAVIEQPLQAPRNEDSHVQIAIQSQDNLVETPVRA